MKIYLLYSHGMHHLVFKGHKTGFQILGNAFLLSEVIDKMKTAGIVKHCFGPNEQNLEFTNVIAQTWLHLELENNWKHYEHMRTQSLLIPEELTNYIALPQNAAWTINTLEGRFERITHDEHLKNGKMGTL